MLGRIEIFRDIFEKSRGREPSDKHKKQSPRRDYSSKIPANDIKNESSIVWSNYSFESFSRAVDAKAFHISVEVRNFKLDYALGFITNGVIEHFGITSNSEQQQVFEAVKQVFLDESLPLKFNNSKKKGLVTYHSIEESIDFMINKLQFAEFAKKCMADKPINQEDKLGIFLKTFSRKILAILPDLLVGQPGNLRHGFFDKAIQARVLKICTALVALDNIANGWKNNTQGQVESRAEASFNYILAVMLIIGITAAVVTLAEKIYQTRLENFKKLKNEFGKTAEQARNIMEIMKQTELVFSEINKQKRSYFYKALMLRTRGFNFPYFLVPA